MWFADALTVVGLVIDVCGAVLLIGIEWKWTMRLGERFNPRFERLDSALNTLGNRPRDDLNPDNDGFDELFDILDIDPGNTQIPAYEFERVTIEAPESSEGDIKFVFKEVNFHPNQNWTSSTSVSLKLAEKVANQYAQKWFIRRGVMLLVFGFILQIIATLIPYLPSQL